MCLEYVTSFEPAAAGCVHAVDGSATSSANISGRAIAFQRDSAFVMLIVSLTPLVAFHAVHALSRNICTCGEWAKMPRLAADRW